MAGCGASEETMKNVHAAGGIKEEDRKLKPFGRRRTAVSEHSKHVSQEGGK